MVIVRPLSLQQQMQQMESENESATPPSVRQWRNTKKVLEGRYIVSVYQLIHKINH